MKENGHMSLNVIYPYTLSALCYYIPYCINFSPVWQLPSIIGPIMTCNAVIGTRQWLYIVILMTLFSNKNSL